MQQQPRPRRAVPGQHGRLRHRRTRATIRTPAAPTWPTSAGSARRSTPTSRSATRARPATRSVPRRGGDAPRRRDDAARGDARRPDGVRALRRSGARRGGLGRVPRRLTRLTPSSAGGPARAVGAGATIDRGAPRWTSGLRTGGAPDRDGSDLPRPASRQPRPSPEVPVAERPHEPAPDFAAANGWDARVRDLHRLRPADLRRPVDVHEPAVDHRSGRAPPPRRRRGDHRRAVRRRRQPPLGRAVRAARRSARRSTRRGRSTRSSSASSRSRS